MFKIGFGLGIALFILLNIASAIFAANEYAAKTIKIAHGGYSWGFPLRMFRHVYVYPNEFGFELLPTAINGIIAGVCAGVLGIILQVLGDRVLKD